MKKYIDKLFCKLGYVPQKKFDTVSAASRRRGMQIEMLKNDIQELNEINTDEIVSAIRKARMVTVKYETPTVAVMSNDFQPPIEKSIFRTTIPPVDEKWYALTTKIDVGLLHRVNEDLLQVGKSLELDYFLEVITRKLIEHTKIAMRLSQ